jgi:hypothetical protein
LVAAAVSGCGHADPPTGPQIAHRIKGTALPDGLGKVTTGYCRHDYSGNYSCVLRTAKGRVDCTVSLDKDGRPIGEYCSKEEAG